MSRLVNLSSLSLEQRKKLTIDLCIKSKENIYNSQNVVNVFDTFTSIQNKVKKYYTALPFFYANSDKFNLINKEYPESSDYSFTGHLNSVQEEVEEEVFDILKRDNCILLSLYCGAGKTIFSIYIASFLKLKTCIICHRLNLIDQWKYSISKVCPDAKIQVVSSKDKLLLDIDFYIINVSNVRKRNYEDYSHIGFLIVDEAHTICTDAGVSSLLLFYPKYLVMLTATHVRSDGMDEVLYLFIGKNIIKRKLYKPFNIYYINTGYTPKVKQNNQGHLDWNYTLEDQAKNEDRNNLIVKIISHFQNRNFLILCKRVDQSKILLNKLNELKEDCDMFVQTSTKFNRNARILISTYSKTGVGFDHPKLDALIMASDVKEGIEQYLFRVFRREDVSPIVFDLVDSLYTMKEHFKSRKLLYESVGGELKNFYNWFS